MNRTLVFGAACSFVLISGGAFAQQANEAADLQPITRPLHIDKSMRLAMSDGCSYDVHVRGKVEPVSSREKMVKPDLRVNADVQCTDGASLGFTRRINSEPLTRAQLEDMLEHQGMLSSPVGRQPCYYAPDFNLSNAGLGLRSVSHRCPMPS